MSVKVRTPKREAIHHPKPNASPEPLYADFSPVTPVDRPIDHNEGETPE